MTTEFLCEFKGNMVQQHQTEILSFYSSKIIEILKWSIKSQCRRKLHLKTQEVHHFICYYPAPACR